MSTFAKRNLLVFLAVVGVSLAFVGCSSNSNDNPASEVTGGAARTEENGLTLAADPMKIVIDPDDPTTPTDPSNGNKLYRETALTAVAKDPSGNPQANLPVTFGAAAGRLASNGQPVNTDADGKATDTLRVYEDDPASIQVSVGDGTRVTTITVEKVLAAPPVANAGPDQTVECTGDSQAEVHLDGAASADPNDDIVTYEWFENFGAPEQTLLGTGETLSVSLALGTHTITLQVTDATGKSSTDEVVVTVVDTMPPVVHLEPSPAILWPPNHRLVDVHVAVNVDECGPYTVTLESVTSNEPDNGLGDGDTAGDIQGVGVGDDSDFQLRAERAGGGDGRLYTIVYKVVDAQGLETMATTTVKVPHDQRGN